MLIPGLQAQGLSASAALDQLKAQGLGMRRQNFLRLWGATIKEKSLREALSTHHPSDTAHASMVVQVPRPRARGIQWNVDSLARDPQTGEFYFTPTAVITEHLNYTFGEIVDIAAANLRAMMAGGRDTIQADIIQGGHITSILERVPETEEVY